MRSLILIVWAVLGISFPMVSGGAEVPTAIRPWLHLLHGDTEASLKALDEIAGEWDSHSPERAIETLRFIRPGQVSQKLIELLKTNTGQTESDHWFDWVQWLWQQPAHEDELTLLLKSELHAPIDSRFQRYFAPNQAHEIRYDEILWGGVRQNGIPPLYRPAMLSADDASYLADSDVVFGIIINGKAFAYPKRILAWHEMFVDTLEGVDLAGVYCTLCGSVILYETEFEGVKHRIGTSGFLYRSNKLMFDEATHSLWSTLEGKPVVGPLVGKGIELKKRSVVTTTWGGWRARYPGTKVLSLQTGHRRDYSEGAAYRDYFATDRLMFPVPFQDRRLANKAEIVGLRLGEKKTPVALSVELLRRKPAYIGRHEDNSFLVLTDSIGTHRVFALDQPFHVDRWNQVDTVVDEMGTRWRVTEDALVASDERQLARVASHRAFWFGWHAAFPDTVLLK